MRDNTRRHFITVAGGSLLAWTGCGPSYRSLTQGYLPPIWDERQKLAGYYRSIRLLFAEKLGPTSNQFTVFYPRQMTADILKQLEKSMDDFNKILDYNNKEWRAYLDYHKLRPDFEREEKAIKALHARIQASNLDDKFQEFMSTRSHDPANHFGRYNPKRLFLERDIVKAFPFTSSLIDEAKTRGTLNFLEGATMRIDQPYHHKEPDPNDPENFPQKFIWIHLKYDLELTSYTIIADASATQNDPKSYYIDGFRVMGGKREPQPALKVFFPRGAPYGVLLADFEKVGEAGYGVPNVVMERTIAGIEDVVRDGQVLLDLFLDKKKSIRIPPKQKPPMVAEVVQVGSPTDVWTDAPDPKIGWIVPFDYPSKPNKDNYNVRIEFKKHGSGSPPSGGLRHIESFVKEWTQNDRYTPSVGGDPEPNVRRSLWEYYRPKSPYDQEVQGGQDGTRVAHNENTKKLVVITKDGEDKGGIMVPRPNKFMEDAPWAIVYKEGEVWYRIEKQGGSAVFNKRRKTSPPKYQTGVYNGSDHEEQP